MSADGSFGFASAPSPEELARLPLNDLGNAMRLIRLVGGTFDEEGEVDQSNAQLLYLRKRGWIAFNGLYWDLEAGEELARRWAHKVASGLIAQGPYCGISGKAWSDFVLKTGSAGSSSAMLTQAASYLAVDLAMFDADPMALNVRNGVLRFRWGSGGPSVDFAGRHSPSDRFTRMADVAYDPEAKAPVFDKHLAFCQPREDMQLYLQKVFGYAATASVKEQIFVILQGKGGDGKSTLVNAIRDTLGSYALSAGVETFLDSGVRRGAEASPDLARLAGDTRMICTAEPPRGSKLASAAIKSFTGGGAVTARELRQGIFEFQPIGKVVLECNGRPTINDTDDGIWRRTRIVMFEHQVSADQIDLDLPAKLKPERSGILNWLAAGVLSWMSEGLKTPEPVRQAIEDYRKGSNPFAEWLSDRVILDADARIISSELYRDYKAWCEEQGHERPMTQTTFGRALGDLQIIGAGKDGSGKKLRRGARLRETWDKVIDPAAQDGVSPGGPKGDELVEGSDDDWAGG